MLAALEYVNSFRPARVIVAVPVASLSGCERVKRFASECICLALPEPFGSVGEWYRNFHQVSDDEIRLLLEQNYHTIGPPVRTIRLPPEAARRL